MSARQHKGQSSHDGRAGTLGDLLYADTAKPRVPESEWIALVRAIAAGDQSALQHLYKRTHRLVFTLAMRIVGDLATAEELTVDVFQEVWRRAADYDEGGGSVIGWIMSQARSRAIDRLRFETRKKRRGPDLPDLEMTAEADIADVVAREDSLAAVLEILTPPERQAIEMAYFGERTYAEVAARLNEPLGTIKTRIRSALEKLRRALLAGASVS